MIRIAITPAAFDAIAATMPFGSANIEPTLTADGERFIWQERAAVNKLRALRQPGESYSEVILRVSPQAARS
jgi:hypothetical protein